jgi:hypothetical protein
MRAERQGRQLADLLAGGYVVLTLVHAPFECQSISRASDPRAGAAMRTERLRRPPYRSRRTSRSPP